MFEMVWIGLLIALGGVMAACILLAIMGIGSFYIFRSIGLYNMAKKLGYDSPWLAWIPWVRLYLMFVLPQKPFCPLAVKREITSRVKAFWIYLAGTVGLELIAGLFTSCSDIPYVGIVFAFIATTIQLAAVFSAVIFQYPMYVDLLEMFLKRETAMICAIVGMIFPSALSIMIFIAGMKDVRRPDEIIGEYVEVE